MRLKSIEDVNEFLSTVNQCSGDVILTSNYGDRYNLKSTLSQYVAISAMLGNHGEELELFCDNKEDELRFVSMFTKNPQIL